MMGGLDVTNAHTHTHTQTGANDITIRDGYLQYFAMKTLPAFLLSMVSVLNLS